jgi:hypothetical protein
LGLHLLSRSLIMEVFGNEFAVHIRGEDLSPEGVKPDENMVEKVRQLLLLTDLVDRYPLVVARRVSGLVYLIVAGGVSFATLVLMSLQDISGPGDPFLVSLGFVIFSLLFSWVVAFRLVVPLTRSYPQERNMDETRNVVVAVWGILAVAMVLVSFITLSAGLASLFPPALQLIMGSIFLTNYILGRRTSLEFHTREHLYFAVVVFLSIIPMVILPSIAYVALIVADMGGIYMIGIYMLVSAERILLGSKGPG